MAKKNILVNAVKARNRVASKTSKKKNPSKKAVSRNKSTTTEELPRKLFDAKKWLGVFPDMAEWYIEYLREEARLNEEKADRLLKALKQPEKAAKPARTTPSGVIDVDKFFGTMPHLKGDAVKVQRKMRDE